MSSLTSFLDSVVNRVIRTFNEAPAKKKEAVESAELTVDELIVVAMKKVNASHHRTSIDREKFQQWFFETYKYDSRNFEDAVAQLARMHVDSWEPILKDIVANFKSMDRQKLLECIIPSIVHSVWTYVPGKNMNLDELVQTRVQAKLEQSFKFDPIDSEGKA